MLFRSLEENLGSRLKNERTGKYELVPGVADAKIDTERGVVVTAAGSSYYAPTNLFGTASCHFVDYDLYFANLQKNVKTRVEAWLSTH